MIIWGKKKKMKIHEFIYTKENGESSSRKVLTLKEKEGHIEGIDLSRLTKEEIIQLEKIQDEYIKSLEPFFRKAYRRFNKDKAENLVEVLFEANNTNLEHA